MSVIRKHCITGTSSWCSRKDTKISIKKKNFEIL